MPRKHAANAAGHEIPPVASNSPAPTAATSSNTNVARKNPAAFAKGIHSAMAEEESDKASVMGIVKPPTPNIQRRTTNGAPRGHWMFDVGGWMLGVPSPLRRDVRSF